MLLRCHQEYVTGERIHLKREVNETIETKSVLHEWLGYALPLFARANKCWLHPFWTSLLQFTVAEMFLHGGATMSFFTFLDRICWRILRQHSWRKSASTVHKRGCCDWPCRWNRSNEIDQSLQNPPYVCFYFIVIREMQWQGSYGRKVGKENNSSTRNPDLSTHFTSFHTCWLQEGCQQGKPEHAKTGPKKLKL